MTMNRKDGRSGGPAKSVTAKSASAKFAPRSAAGAPAWSVPLKVDAIPDTGLSRDIEASLEICTAVAELAEVRAISGLKASFDLSRAGDVVHVTGRVTAHVDQNCVVTLDPLVFMIDESIDVLFAPVPEEGTETHDAHRRKTEEELPEPLIDGAIDLGAIACEFLLLGIEPYPRKPGVEFTPPEVEPDGPHPFAALAALKKTEP
jgi:uncharacterized metal-binding protein YceD (DUF177 family)